MRLTLRTLLAWLDGVLPAEEQRELGEKVAAHQVAAHLADRIRGVVGRTAIGAPKVDGRGLTEDPNSVAEYLDNTLSHDLLESFERICVESDVHLAEVAACHKMLAEVAHDTRLENQLDPQRLQQLQQRVLGLLAGLRDGLNTDHSPAIPAFARLDASHHESRETARALRGVMVSTAGATGKASANGHGDSGAGLLANAAANGRDPAAAGAESFQPLLVNSGATPPRGPAARRSSMAAWAAAVLAASLLLALTGVLAWSVIRGGIAKPVPPLPPVAAVDHLSPGPVQPPPSVTAADSQPAGNGPAAADMPADSTALPPSDSVAANPPKAGDAMPGAAPKPGEQPSPSGSPDPVPPAVPQAGQLAPTVAVVPVAVPPVAAVTLPTVAVPAAAAFPAGDAAAPADLGFVGGGGVLLRLTPNTAGTPTWTTFPKGLSLHNPEDLLVPPGFHPELHVRGVIVRLLPETRAVISVDDDDTPRIEVVFGRAVARASRADARLGITAAGLVGTVDGGLLEPVGIQVQRDRIVGEKAVGTPVRVQAEIITGSGGLVWRQTAAGGLPVAAALGGIAVQGLLDPATTLTWESVAPDQVAVVRSGTTPAWIESAPRSDKLERAACEALAVKVAGPAPLTQSLREMATDKRAENRALAAATLALIGEFDELVEVLCADGPGRKLEAAPWLLLESTTVPLALSRGEHAASKLKESFVNRGPSGKADLLWWMACGLTPADLAKGADRALVEALEDDDLVVRRYASKTLVELTRVGAADRGRYRPDGQPDMRREGVNWWRAQMEKGLIRHPGDVEAAVEPAPRAALGEDGDPPDLD